MKKVIFVLALSMLAICSVFADVTKTMDATLDLTSQNYVSFWFADDSSSTAAIDTLTLNSDFSSLPEVKGKGSFCINWDIISSSSFSLRVYSQAMKNSNSETLNWSLTDGSKTYLDKSNNYGGNTNNLIYKHDSEGVAVGNKDSLSLTVNTDDVSTMRNSEYSTVLKLLLETV